MRMALLNALMSSVLSHRGVVAEFVFVFKEVLGATFRGSDGIISDRLGSPARCWLTSYSSINKRIKSCDFNPKKEL